MNPLNATTNQSSSSVQFVSFANAMHGFGTVPGTECPCAFRTECSTNSPSPMTGDVELQVILDIDAKGVIRGTVLSIMGEQVLYAKPGTTVRVTSFNFQQYTVHSAHGSW